MLRSTQRYDVLLPQRGNLIQPRASSAERNAALGMDQKINREP